MAARWKYWVKMVPPRCDEADVEAAVLVVRAALHAVDDAVVGGVDRLAPDLAAEVDAAVAAAALARAVARPLGAEDARVADGHAPVGTVERVQPGVGGDLGQPVLLGRRPGRPERRRLGRRRRTAATGATPTLAPTRRRCGACNRW